MPGAVDKPAQLPEEIGMYVDELRRQCPSLEEVWALGPRVSTTDPDASWDLLAFGDVAALETVRRNRSLHRDDVTLVIVTDGDSFETAWGEDRRRGRLTALGWRLEDPQTASYRAPVTDNGSDAAAAETLTAVRVR